MAPKPGSQSPLQRVAAAWNDMRKRARPGKNAADVAAENAAGYAVELAAAEQMAVFRVYRPATGRGEMARRMTELIELMRKHQYAQALIDVRACAFDDKVAANDLSEEGTLPYAISPLWRIALLLPPEGQTGAATAAMFDAWYRLHRRAGVRMRRFEDYVLALDWLQQPDSHASPKRP